MGQPNTKPAAQPVAYSYIRFSSPEQAKGDSLRRQTDMRDAWLARTGATLDTSLSLRDEGVSAFGGDHRDNPDRHALAAFLDLVRAGRIARGSYLIIENLDRLTREDAVPALNLFTGILAAGVRVVQLDPESVYTHKSEYMEILRALLELSRGNSESRNKARRMGAVWEEKRKRAAAGEVMTRTCPGWMRVEGSGRSAKFVLIPERAEVVRRIFRLAIDGVGVRIIARQMDTEGVPVMGGRATKWSKSYVRHVLLNRGAFGEFTPRTNRSGSGGRSYVGGPIANYYPPVITADQWHAAQAAMKGRAVSSGRPAKTGVNVFAGLLHDARTGGRLHLHQYAPSVGARQTYIAPEDTGLNKRVSFPLDVFEAAVLTALREIDPRSILPAEDAAADAALALAGRKAEVETRLAALKARLRTGSDIDTLLDLVRELEAERKRLADELAAAELAAATPRANAWADARSLLEVIGKAPDVAAARMKLRGLLRRTVESVWCLFMPGRHEGRPAAVQVWFPGGAHRDYLILYRPLHVTRSQQARPECWSCRSLALPGLDAEARLDLRNRADAAALEGLLGGVGLDQLGG